MLNRTTIHSAVAVLAIFFFAAFNNRTHAAFADGDFVTHVQVDWGSSAPGMPGALLATVDPFSTLYPFGLLIGVIGVPDQYSILFSSGSEMLDYLPTSGPSIALTQNYVDPVVPAGGLFGGDVAALHLNVGFNDAALIGGNLDIAFGDLLLHDITGLPALNGMSIREFVELVDLTLGGGNSGYTPAQVTPLAGQLNASFFNGGTVSQFAQDHLRLPVDMRGDFNQNGTVDAADYVVWRDTLQGLRQTAELYGHWRANFGNTTLSGASQAAVPEPTAAGLALLSLLGLASRRNQARSQC